MDIRGEIRRILKEELASLVNPLDATADAITQQTSAFSDKISALKGRIDKGKKDMTTDLNAKKKAVMVPQSNVPSIERERRQLDNMKIKDIEEKLKDAEEQEGDIDSLETDINRMSGSLDDLNMQREKLQAAIAKMGGAEP